MEADGRTWRTLLHPDFFPCLVLLSLPVRGGDVGVERFVPLHGRSGRPCSGRINGVGRDSPIRDSSGASSLPPDPLGIDPEGLVRLPDGTFWIAEEYRPSLLKVAADGTVLARFIPEGESLPGADTEVCAVLPRHYACRRDNRGFEAWPRRRMAAGIAPVGKELVADLTRLRAAMAAEADDSADARHGPLKLEGLAVLDERHVVVVNDNDFGVQGKGGPARRTCLWTIELARPLPGR